MNTLSTLLRVDPAARTPLATQLTEQLTLLIASGRIGAGDELPPVRELAEVLGIHLHTVRAAYKMLEEDNLVSGRQGRRTTVREFDRVDYSAQVPDVPTFAIGVVLANYSPFYAPLVEAIEVESEDPSLVLMCNARNDPRRELEYLDQLVARRVDGIIVVSPSFGRSTKNLGRDLPVVYVDWPDADGPSVNFELENAGFVATEHLLGHGHQRIGLIGPSPEWSNVAAKLAGYRRALEAANIEFDPELVVTTEDFDSDSGRTGAAALLGMEQPPTAAFAMSDVLALGVLEEMSGRGIGPSDLAVAGSDDIAVAARTSPQLTTVHLPAYEAGTLARHMVDALKAGSELEAESVVLPTELVIRASCGC